MIINGESLVNIISTSKMKIPDNQRPYEWDKDLLEKFNESLIGYIEDIFEYNLKKPRARKKMDDEGSQPNWYLGAMIFYDKKGTMKNISIVDGQQRLLTFTIYSLIFDKVIKENRRDNNSQWRGLCSSDDAVGKLFDEIAKIGKNGKKNISFNTSTLNDRMTIMFEELEKFSFDKEKFHNDQTHPPRYNDDGRDAISKKLSLIYKLITYGEDCFMNRIKSLFEDWAGKAREQSAVNDESYDDRFDDLKEYWGDLFKNNIRITDIVTKNELSGYMLYEDFNSKRKALSSDSLIKNYIFKKLHSDEDLRKEAADSWDNTIKTLDENDNLSMREYVRYFWNSREKFARERNLYNLFAQAIDKEYENVDEDNLKQNIWIEEWEKNLGSYLPLLSSKAMREIYGLTRSDQNYDSYKKDFVKVTFRLGILKAKTWIPAALSILTTDLNDKWKMALKLVELAEKTTLMLSILDDSPAPYELIFTRFAFNDSANYSESDIRSNPFLNEPGITQLAAKAEFNESVIESRINKLEEEISIKLDLINRYQLIENTILNKPIGESVAKCILFKHLQDDYTQDDLANFNLDKKYTQLEHIFPKKAILAEWPGWTEDDDSFEHLGNLILLSANPNKECGIKPFDKKLDVYAKYTTVKFSYLDWCKEKDIVNSDYTFKEAWKPEHIKERSRHVWYKVREYYKFD